MKNIASVLEELITTDSVSGYEWEMGITQTIQKIIGFHGEKIFDNLVYKLGTGKRIVFVSAHMDEVGFFLTKPTAKRRSIVPIGDIVIDDVIGERLFFSNKSKGFVSDPIKKAKTFSQVSVTGISMLPEGSVGTFLKKISRQNNLIQAPNLDNKVGCVVLIELIRYFAKKQPDITIFFCFSSREEVGTNGVTSAVRQIKPNLFIDIDSAYARPVSKNKKNWQIPKIGKGPAIQLQGKNFVIRSENRFFIEKVARESNIEIQYEIPPSNAGGTNSSSVVNMGYDIMQINIPVTNQHGTKSKASLRDIEKTVDLMRGLLERVSINMLSSRYE